MVRRISLPSPAMVVACVALGVALGGTSYAAISIPRDSVGRSAIREGAVGTAQIRDFSIAAKDVRLGALTSSQLRDGSVNGRDLRAGTLGSTQIRNGSIAARDLARGVLPAPGTSVVRQESGAAVAPSTVGAVSASCKAGERATGGGGGFAGPPTTKDAVADTIPVGDGVPMRWRVSLFNGGESPRTPVAYVLCATG